MPLSHKHKCLFIHIPKTAGTSIESALDILGNWQEENIEILFGLIQSENLKKHRFKSNFLQHLTLEQIHKITTIPDYFVSFSFVRNPWDKMVSIYSNPDNNLVNVASSQGVDIKDLSFDDFIEQTEHIKHIHLEHQHTFICNQNHNIAIDFVGKFESINEDFNKLCTLLGHSLNLPHKNASTRNNYRDYYSQKTKKIIARRYERDIELFNYRF